VLESERQVCPGCGVQLLGVAGPTHPYLLSSPSCWNRYGELLAAQYASPPRMAFHQLVVDAYAVQHPGGDDPRAVQSVGIHLMTLCLFVEDGVDPSLGTTLHKRMVERPVFQWLHPPRGAGSLTVLDVPVEGDPAVARQQALLWAVSAWRAWQVHHDTVRRWLTDSELGQTAPR
jgi:hypothetical protein